VGRDLFSDRRCNPKTYARYLRLCCLVAGVRVDEPIDLDDAIDITDMMVCMRRVPPAEKWVDSLIEGAKADAVEGLF
jgi:hypothetical protein